ncbi:DUF1420 family protein [Polluticoccus soli]|uniref:DUF1420 family protein n=1 Tax=Polluticoccus soli TaxID=3034150 RepID=UPI0023E351C3|nr:DUF1420 family protein [Flavipsychrobacter sp. JY13-12]
MDITAFFLPAFLSTVMTVAAGCSMAIVFDWLGRRIFKTDEVLARAMYFLTGLLMLSWLLLLAGMAGVVQVEWVRRVPCVFIVFAVLIVIGTRSFQPIHLFMQPFRMPVSSRWDKITRTAIYITTGALFLVCLAPPTDADSLDYHLGVPVDMLSSGGLFFDARNLHFRMFGFGEMLNLPGVAAGYPQLGAFIQFLAFRYLLRVYSDPVNGKTRLDLLAVFMGIPLLLFFVSGEKHQLTGMVATSLAFYALLQRDGHLRKPYTFLFWAVLVFAVGIKYSFIISAAVIAVMLIVKDRSWPHVSQNMFAGILVSIVFLAPLYVFKVIRFGDPLSPLLERFRAHPDPVAVHLQLFLREFTDSAFPLPLNLFIPSSLGLLTTVIGLAAAIIFIFLFSRGFWAEKLTVLLFVVFTILLGQPTARFFMEPLLWVTPLFFASLSASKWQKLLFGGLRVQLLAMLPIILFTVYSFAPGLFTNKGRDEVMRSYAVGYAESRWIDSTLPPGVKISTALRSRALVPRDNFAVEYLAYSAKDQSQVDSLIAGMRSFGVEYFVVPGYYLDALDTSYVFPPIAHHEFSVATRNPMNASMYTLNICKAKP